MDDITQYIASLRDLRVMTPDMERLFAKRRLRRDPAVWQDIVTANVKLVISIANHYAHIGVPLFDLIGAGNVGLCLAAKRWNPHKGSLPNWLSSYIRGYILRELNRMAHPASISGRASHRHNVMLRAAREFEERHGRPPTDGELAAELDIEASQLAKWRMLWCKPVPLNAPCRRSPAHTRDEDTASGHVAALLDMEPFADHDAAAKLLDQAHLHRGRERVRALILRLTPKQQRILRLLYPVNGDRKYTVREAAVKLHMGFRNVGMESKVAIRRLAALLREDAAIRYASYLRLGADYQLARAAHSKNGNGRNHLQT